MLTDLDPTISRAVAFALALSGCGSAQAPRNEPTVDYEVHEWGLVHGAPNDTAEASAVSAQPPESMTLSDKPVLYFHAEEPFTLRSVTVTATDGFVREHWPLTGPSPNPPSVRWTDLRIGGDRCEPVRLPRLDERPCTDAPTGSDCEAVSLAITRTPSALCIRSRGIEESFLFYRSTSRTFVPTLRATREANDAVRIERVGRDEIPGGILIVRRVGGVTRIQIRRLMRDEVIVRPGDEGGTVDAATASLRATMLRIGLDRSEADAFLRAWTVPIFGPGGAADSRGAVDDRISDETSQDRRSADVALAPGPALALVYFLPVSSVDSVARLSFDPPPRRVVRSMAVWQPIP